MTQTLSPEPIQSDAFRQVVDGAPGLLWMGDHLGRCVFLNRAQREFWGVGHGDLSGFSWNQTVHPDDLDKLAAPFAAGMEKQEPFSCEARYLRADGVFRVLRTDAQPRFAADGSFLGMVGVNTDVTESRELEQQLTLLNRELTHRIKNIFSVVQGLISVSARANPGAAPAMRQLRERIGSMAGAYEVIRPAQEGGVGEGTLRQLIDVLFAPYQDPADPSLIIGGDDAPLGAKAATTLALILHEQVTNAIKHGSLSAAGGYVHLDVTVTDNTCTLFWRETGGPVVLGAPQAKGFGSLLLSTSVTALGGSIDAHWHPQGLRWRLSLPLDYLGS